MKRQDKSLLEFEELKQNVLVHAFISKKTPKIEKKNGSEEGSLLRYF